MIILNEEKRKVVCLIPVRGGSKRFPGKNKLLLPEAIRKAKKCLFIDEVWVSTEDAELSDIAKREGAKVLKRPEILASDEATTEDVMMHFSYNVDYDDIFLFECTHPLTTKEEVTSFVKEYLLSTRVFKYSYISVKRKKEFVWKEEGSYIYPPYNIGKSPRTQDFEGILIEAGGMYMTNRESFMSSFARVSHPIKYFEVSEYNTDVDRELDYKIAELIKSVQE